MDEATPSQWDRVGDALLVVVLGVVALLEFTRDRSPSAPEVAAAAVIIVALFFRRGHPVAVVCVVACAFVFLLSMAAPTLACGVAMLVAAYSGVLYARSGRALVLAVVAAVAGWSAGMALTPASDLGSRVVSTAWVAVPLVLGAVMRAQVGRATRAERRTAEAASVLAEERDRIAREIHDVVAHALAVVVLHARGGQEAHRHGDEDAAAQALAVVEAVGSQALSDMRRLVTLIRVPQDRGAPSPSLRYLDDLVGSVRSAGLVVDLDVRGDLTSVPSGVDAAAFRFVQEALTNVIKHAGGAPATVSIDVSATALELVVEDDGPGVSEPREHPGHGLVGMAERVAVYGGQFASGTRPGRGFRVWASLPLGSS